MKQNIFPTARQRDVVVQELSNETLVYDLKTNKVFCLNKTSAAIWQICNGKTSIIKIADKLNLPEEIVIFALKELQINNLLKVNNDWAFTINQVSRRNIITKFGKTAIALPLISVLVAPQAINAQSECVGPTTQSCTVGLGACQRTGIQTRTCVAGVFTPFGPCSASPGIPSAEIPANGIDDNCNGQTDEP